MKLLFFLEPESSFGGGGYSVLKFAEHLSEKHEGKIIQMGFNRITLANQSRLTVRTPFISCSFPGSRRLNRLLDSAYTMTILPFLIHKWNPDYLIGYLRESAQRSCTMAKKYGIRNASFVFESPPWMEKDLGERWKLEYQGKFKRSWERTRLAYIDSKVLICNSRLSMKECQAWTGRKPDGFAYPGIDPVTADMAEAESERQIIYIGRLNPYKNVDEILLALARVRNPPKLVIVGDGEERRKLEKMASEMRLDVEFKGILSDEEKFREMKRSLFMVFPSSHEGFGMPPMEALYCGIPCICSSKQIFREVYEDKVEYFTEHDVFNLAQKIEGMMKNASYCRRRGAEGRKYVSSRFRWTKSAEKIEKMLKENL